MKTGSFPEMGTAERASGGLGWVAVEELNLSYHDMDI